jgi:hypothetical protein
MRPALKIDQFPALQARFNSDLALGKAEFQEIVPALHRHRAG